MKLLLTTLATTLLSLTSAAPVSDNAPNGYGANFRFPLNNGFPNPSAKAIANIQRLAGGSLPNGPAPADPGATGALDFMVIAVNEITEVAFFSELLHNVSNKVPGYEMPAGLDYDYVVEVLTAVKHQEELHALAANSVLAAYNYPTISPCAYTFPVTTFSSAIAIAATFTDLVLGALQSVNVDLATSSNTVLAQILASIIGQEGEQDGFYRFAQKKTPSAAPFLTNTNGIFAYNALMQLFIVPGSCTNMPSQLSSLPTLGAMTVVSPAMPQPMNGTITFMVKGTLDSSSCVTYMSGQNVPLTVPITSFKVADGMTTFTASFPFEQPGAGFAKGLTVAAVTGAGPYTDGLEVAMKATYGPGLIEVM